MASGPAQTPHASASAPSSPPVATHSSPPARDPPLSPLVAHDFAFSSPTPSLVRETLPQPHDARRVRFGGYTIGPTAGTSARTFAPSAPTRSASAAPSGPRVTVRAPPSDARPKTWRRPNAPTSLSLSGSSSRGSSPLAGPSTLADADNSPPRQPQQAQLHTAPALSRRNHPGPLNLAERLPRDEGAQSSQATSVADQLYHDANIESSIPEETTGPAGRVPSNDSSHTAAMQRSPLADLGVRELNARGLDGQALVALQSQLKKLGMGRLADGNIRPDGQPRDPPNPLRDPLRDQSGSVTPSDASYDPMADSDLDHIPMVEGEVDGMPARVRSSDKQDHELKDDLRKVQTNIKSVFGKTLSVFRNRRSKSAKAKGDAETEKIEEGRADQPSVGSGDKAGTTNRKSVPVHTSTGQRGTWSKPKPSKYERQAARLVRAHRLFMGNRPNSRSGSSSDLSVGAPAGDVLFPDEPTNAEPQQPKPQASGEPESDGPTPETRTDARPAASGGVLGHLLMLYEQQQREQKEAQQGRPVTTSSDISGEDGRTTVPPSGSLPPSSLDSPHGPRPNPFGIRRRPVSRIGSVMGSPASSVTAGGTRYSKRGSHLAYEGRQAIRHVESAVASASAVMKGDYDLEDRPRAARSSAGVFGALVATANNLIGVASPTAAQLGSNPFRSGYTLYRYFLPEMNAKTMRRTAKIVAQASGPVPQPMHMARTPGILRTPSVYHGSGRATPSAPATSAPQSELGQQSESDSVAGGGQSAPPFASAPSTPHRSSYFGGLTNVLHHTEHAALYPWRSVAALSTPAASEATTDYFGPGATDQLRWQQHEARLNKEQWQRKVRKRAKRTKKEEIYITLHVAAILQRQEFLLKLARALMMFGAPTHRIETQMQATARILDVQCRCIYLPSLMLVSFGDDLTHTSDTRFIKQPSVLDLSKLTDMHSIWSNTVRDKIGVDEASRKLDELMRRKPVTNRFVMCIVGGLCSSFICAGPMGFNGSFVDCLLAFPLGAFLVYVQLSIKAELFSNVFEICFAGLNSFIVAAAYQNGTSGICYAAVAPASIVLILPGFYFLTGSLELQSKSIIAGSVRLVYGFLYALFLGFGLSIGALVYTFISGKVIDATGDSTCERSHDRDEWYFKTIGIYYAFLCVPGYAMGLALRNYAKPVRKEFFVMTIIAVSGWLVVHFSGKRKALENRQDFTAMLGSLTVGVASSLYGAFFDGRSFVVAVPGVLYMLPSGWQGGGLLAFANTNYTSDNSSTVTARSSISSGFQVAESLLSVALGLSVGLFSATLLSYYLLGGARGRGLFSF